MLDPKLIKKNMRESILRWRSDPVSFVVEAVGVPEEKIDEQQKKLLRALPGNRFISGKSGHGIGKTATESWIIYWFLMCYPNSRVICTAPTEDQLTKIMWPEAAKWYEKSKLKEYIQWNKAKIFIRGEEETAFAVYRTATKPEALQGFHADNILFILDEASGIDDEIWEPVEGALTSGNSRAIALGNPTRPEGAFYRTFTENSNFWKTFTFSSVDSTLVSPEYVDRMKRKYGEDSDVYRVRVLGEFPSQVSNAFIPLFLCERSLNNEVEHTPFLKMGVDIARFGDDYSVWVIRAGGRIIKVVKRQLMDTMEVAGQTARLMDDFRIAGENVYLDVIGVGAGVVDRLNELKRSVNGVNVAESPMESNELIYLNKRAELWGIVKQELTNKKLNLKVESDIEMTNDLCGELASPQYKFTSKGQYQIESKEDMKRRGVQSPNIADALCLSYASMNIGSGTIMGGAGISYGDNY